MTLRALTVRQPWAEAISLADDIFLGDWAKLSENRTRPPPVAMIGQEIAIHAGKAALDEDEAVEVGKMLFNKLPDRLRVKLVRDAYTKGQWYYRLHEGMGKILCVATIAGVAWSKAELSPAQQRWWKGDVAWKLKDVRTLHRPISCKGQLGLWEVPDDVLGQLRMQIPARAA